MRVSLLSRLVTQIQPLGTLVALVKPNADGGSKKVRRNN